MYINSQIIDYTRYTTTLLFGVYKLPNDLYLDIIICFPLTHIYSPYVYVFHTRHPISVTQQNKPTRSRMLQLRAHGGFPRRNVHTFGACAGPPMPRRAHERKSAPRCDPRSAVLGVLRRPRLGRHFHFRVRRPRERFDFPCISSLGNFADRANSAVTCVCVCVSVCVCVYITVSNTQLRI